MTLTLLFLKEKVLKVCSKRMGNTSFYIKILDLTIKQSALQLPLLSQKFCVSSKMNSQPFITASCRYIQMLKALTCVYMHTHTSHLNLIHMFLSF